MELHIGSTICYTLTESMMELHPSQVEIYMPANEYFELNRRVAYASARTTYDRAQAH
jgi:hypothetical protein